MSTTEGAFPTSHTTSTTTKVNPLVWFDSSYVKTMPGMLKIVCACVDLLGFIFSSVGSRQTSPSVGFFSFVSMFAFWVSLILLFLYLFHVVEKLHTLPWLIAEFVYCLLTSIFYFFAALFIALQGGIYAAAGFFGFVAMSLYGVDSYLKYKAYNSGEIAQGERSNNVNPGTNA